MRERLFVKVSTVVMRIISKSFEVSARKITQSCKDPQGILKTLRRTMKNTQELVQAFYVVDLINDLRKRKIGFKSVEEIASCMCKGLPGGRTRTLVNTIMTWKLKDAHERVNKARCKNTREWRAVYPIIRQARIFDSYSQLWIREKRKLKDELAIKRKRKVAFLTEKYSKKRVTPDVVEGIFVGDQELDGGFTSEPRCYGACDVSGIEKQALSLPPKFAVYTKVNSVSVEAEIEKGLAKYRWEQIERKEPVEEAGVVYDTATKKVDMRNLRATDFPFNKRVLLLSVLSEEKEVGLQHLKNNMLKSVNNYVQLTMYSIHYMNKQWQNLTVKLMRRMD